MADKIINTNFKATYEAVEALCKTETSGDNGNETTLWDWMKAGNWQTMTIQDMADEWDSLSEQ